MVVVIYCTSNDDFIYTKKIFIVPLVFKVKDDEYVIFFESKLAGIVKTLHLFRCCENFCHYDVL
jgi:hypothetical protein